MNGKTLSPDSHRPTLGIALMLLVYFLFSCLDASVKWLAVAGLPALQLAFMRYFGHFIISTSKLLRAGVLAQSIQAPSFGLVFLRGLLLMASTVLNFLALQYIPLSVTSTIMFASPIIVCALSGPLLGERVGIWRWIAIFTGFAGVLVAIRPFDASFHWAMLLSITNVCFYSLYAILTRKLAGKVPIDTLQFFAGVVGTAVLLPFAVYTWQMPSNPLEWLILLSLGIYGWCGHEMLTRAHEHSEASALTPYAYVFIVYMTAWGYVLFGDKPDRWTILGAAIVIASGLFIWFRERRLGVAKPARIRG